MIFLKRLSKCRRFLILSISISSLLLNKNVEGAVISEQDQEHKGLRYSGDKNINKIQSRNLQQEDTNNIFCENVFLVDIEPDPKNPNDRGRTETRCLTSAADTTTGKKSKKIYNVVGLPTNKKTELDEEAGLFGGNLGMLIKDGMLYQSDDSTISLPSNADVFVSKYQGNDRRLVTTVTTPSPYDGTKNVLVIRAIGSENQQPDANAATLSNRIFGGNGDTLNLKSGYAACSGNQLSIEQATGNNQIVNGVLEVNLNINTDGQSGSTLENAIATAAKAKLGTTQELENMYDLVMMCLPPGTSVSTAYAYVGWKRSVYNNHWCVSPSGQMHEIGHNIGLYHANENNQPYDDQSCLMGYSYTSNHEFPKMCFNGAKSWLLGWYDDKSISLNFDPSNQSTWSGKLVGVTDYLAATPNEHVVVAEIVTGNHADNNVDNYYLLYNRKAGINSEVIEFGNQVTITKGHFQATSTTLRENDESEHLAHLSAGNSYTISNYKGTGNTLIIKFCEAVTGSTPAYARVGIYFSTEPDQCSAPPTPPTPTPPTPTPPVTNPPTNSPTKSPTRAPTPPSDCSSGEFKFLLQLQTDNYPGETSWDISTGGVVVAQSSGSLQASFLYEHNLCLADGCYDFKLNDTWGDGICCGYGQGWYKGYLYGDVSNDPVFQGGEFGNSIVERFCGTSTPSPPTPTPPSPTPPTDAPTRSPTQFPTKSPTQFPTKSPTQFPTKSPTQFPTKSPTSTGQCPSDQFELEVSLLTDNYPGETSFYVSNSNNVRVMEENGPFARHTNYMYDGCFDTGCYAFRINDSYGDGICCSYGEGNFEVKVDGAKVLEGGNFGSSFMDTFCVCPAGSKSFELNIVADSYPGETSWEIKNSMNQVVQSGRSNGARGCLPDDCYTFFIYDSYGDGICCGYGQGSFTLSYDNNAVVSGGEFGRVFSETFGGSCAIAGAMEPSFVELDQSYEKHMDDVDDANITDNTDDEEDEKEGGIKCLLKNIFRIFN